MFVPLNDWETIVDQANAMKGWLAKFIDKSNEIPAVPELMELLDLKNQAELREEIEFIFKDAQR